MKGERVHGLAPDWRTHRSLSLESTHVSRSRSGQPFGPLLVPLLTGPALKAGWGRTIVIGTHSGLFALRLAVELLRGPPRVLAFTLRTDSAHLRAWSTIVANLEHLGQLRGAWFITAGAAADGVAARR